MPAVKRVHYAWVVAAVTFIALLGAAGFRATPSILIVPLQNEFGWNRAVISLAVSINLILFGLTGPFAAALMDRFGLRAVAVGALITIAAGALLTTQMNAPWQLYLLWGVVVGLGSGSIASVLAPRKWCQESTSTPPLGRSASLMTFGAVFLVGGYFAEIARKRLISQMREVPA